MKIPRDENNFDQVKFYLRLININELMKNEIVSKFKYEKIKFKRNKDSNSFVLLVELEEISNADNVKLIIKDYSISEDGYGLWITYSSKYDQGGFTLPENITRLHRIIGGKIDFSIINI
jgi:hypothetical protein